MTYSEKLRDPRWQKKRLEIMERDQFACCHCGDKEKTLNVHHRYYLKGKSPWDYDNDALLTVCEECHMAIEHAKQVAGIAISDDSAVRDFYRDITTPRMCSFLNGATGWNKSLTAFRANPCEETMQPLRMDTLHMMAVLMNTLQGAEMMSLGIQDITPIHQ
jgi:hypothetical protein